MSGNNGINLEQFDFNAFQEDAISQLNSGQSLTGKDGVLTPLIKKILEAALEGEMDSHLSDCREQGLSNRRNGKPGRVINYVFRLQIRLICTKLYKFSLQKSN